MMEEGEKGMEKRGGVVVRRWELLERRVDARKMEVSRVETRVGGE